MQQHTTKTFQKKGPQKGEEGYILLEIVIALFVIGVLMGSVLPLYTSHVERQKYKTTEQRFVEIKAALKNYFHLHKKFPRPATANKDSSEFGKAPAASRSVGIVPFLDLGLSPGAVKDAYGNWFTYAMGREMRGLGSFFGDTSTAAVGANMTVTVYEQGKPLVYGKDKTSIDYVLVSHGKNGCGAFEETGGRRIDHCNPFGADERKNANGSGDYVQKPFNDQEGESYFDDMVVFETSIQVP
jgi:type II secretory pathway pseudopilin PulG